VNMQRELAKKNKELEELNRLKNQFLGIAAHDLRNPIGMVLSYAELLQEEKNNLSKEAQLFVIRIRKSASFMLELINNLLDVSAIESGQLNLDLQQYDLSVVIQEIIETYVIFAARKSMQLVFQGTAQPVWVMIDRARFEQAVSNLISNAIKFSPPGSETIIRIEKTAVNVHLSVIDRGPGIPLEEQKNLFQPFRRTSVKATGGEKSTGLGLVIVKKIIESQGGSIDLQSEPGKGSEFIVTIPLIF
jgi:two-component system, OmpR family, sensor kinase